MVECLSARPSRSYSDIWVSPPSSCQPALIPDRLSKLASALSMQFLSGARPTSIKPNLVGLQLVCPSICLRGCPLPEYDHPRHGSKVSSCKVPATARVSCAHRGITREIQVLTKHNFHVQHVHHQHSHLILLSLFRMDIASPLILFQSLCSIVIKQDFHSDPGRRHAISVTTCLEFYSEP